MLDKIYIFFYYLKFKYFLRFKTREKLEKYQERRQKKLEKFARRKSSYYKERLKDGIENLDYITKKDFMDQFNTINTVSVDLDEALSIALSGEESRDFSPKLKNITVGLSSGTSGHRGVFLVSNKEKNLWVGAILAKCLYSGIFSNYKIAFFLRADSNLYEGINSKKIVFKYFDMLKSIDENYKELKRFSPDILVAPPQVLLQLTQSDISSFKFKKIISVAEVLEDSDRVRIENTFNIRVDQVYQCTEGFLACTCKYGTLHINEDIIRLEKEYIDKSNARFTPIITDLYRTSQPIIKYRLNDILVEETKKCKCGSIFCSIKKIEGRQDDIFIFDSNDGKKVYIYPDYIRRCFLFVENINEYKIEQISKEHVKIYLSVSSNLEYVKKQLLEELGKLSKMYNFEFHKITFCDYTHDSSQKLIRVKRLFKEDDYNEKT